MRSLAAILLVLAGCSAQPDAPPPIDLTVEQITHPPGEHFFGYIGHVQTIPWNASGRYALALRVGFHDRMPAPQDAAEVLLLDAQDGDRPRVVDRTLAWNPQQGTMMYWNPDAAETQFFFNDRDPETDKVFTVLYDVAEGRRLREYRFEDTPVGNGGVSQSGGFFAAINYARMARLRPVTGYPGTWDWTVDDPHPDDDGVFKIDIATGEKDLLVSFRRIRDALVERHPHVVDTPLFINHTLWNRTGTRLFFFARGNFGNRAERVNVPMTIEADGSNLREQAVFIGGHPEWADGNRMIGHVDGELVFYDTDTMEVVGPVGPPDVFPDPENDVALSPDGNWIVQGIEENERTSYVVYRLSDGASARSPWFAQTGYSSGDLRIDAAPKWNRTSDAVMFSSLTEGDNPTRQLYLIRVSSTR